MGRLRKGEEIERNKGGSQKLMKREGVRKEQRFTREEFTREE